MQNVKNFEYSIFCVIILLYLIMDLLTVVFIDHEPFSPRREKIFCIKELSKVDGISIKFWDIHALEAPGYKIPDEIKNESFITCFEKVNNFRKAVNLLEPDKTVIIAEFFFQFESRKFWKIICNKGIPIYKFERFANTNICKNIVPISFSNILKEIKSRLFNLYIRIYHIYQYDKLITSSDVPCELRVNHPDYDDYLLHKDDAPVVQGDYIVFIDTGFGIHPDTKFFSRFKYNDNNELWQTKLCSFFSFLENKYNMPVIIAVHPKVTYSESAFGCRKKIRNATLNLVSHAKIVLQDVSNSISFSILFNKPIGLIVTNEFMSHNHENRYMKALSALTSIPIFYIGFDDYDNFKPMNLKSQIREKYIYKYLTSNKTENLLTSDIVIKYFNEKRKNNA